MSQELIFFLPLPLKLIYPEFEITNISQAIKHFLGGQVVTVNAVREKPQLESILLTSVATYQLGL